MTVPACSVGHTDRFCTVLARYLNVKTRAPFLPPGYAYKTMIVKGQVS